MKQTEEEIEEILEEDEQQEEPAEPTVKKKDLLIQQRIYDMILYGYPALEQMPKSQKFSLAQDIKHCMDRIMRLTITANKKYTKRTTLQELDVEIASQYPCGLHMICGIFLQRSMRSGLEWWWKSAKW